MLKANWSTYVILASMSIFLLLLLFSIILVFINRKIKKNLLSRIINFLFHIAVIILYIIAMYLFVYIFGLVIFIVYNLFNELFNLLFKNQLVSTYLSLVISLVVLAYFPDKIGRLATRLVEKLIKEKMDKHYSVLIKLIRFKLWFYLAAFILMLLYATEILLEKDLFIFPLWLQFKPVILQSVVTFIALDRFLKLLGDEWQSIKGDYCEVINTLKSFVKDLTIRK